jgi:hypothetical protein
VVDFALFTVMPIVNTATVVLRIGTKKKLVLPINLKVRKAMATNDSPLNKFGNDSAVGFCVQRQLLLLLFLLLFRCYTKK